MSTIATAIRRGFTLIELLVVVLVIAIIAASAVVFTSGLVTDSAETVNIGTIKHLTSEVSAFYQAHGRLMPEGLDSLMRDDYATTWGTRTFTSTAATGPAQIVSGDDDERGIIYTGCDADGDGVADTGATAQGISPVAWAGNPAGFCSLTVGKLSAADLAALKSIGITYVYDIDHSVDAKAGALTYQKRSLAVDAPVAMVDVARSGKPATWKNLAGPNTLSSTPDKYTYGRFLVFGIGPNCALIGDRRGGLQEAPNAVNLARSV